MKAGTTGTNANSATDANERDRVRHANGAPLVREDRPDELRERACPGSGGEAPGIENVVRAIIYDVARQETTGIERDDDLVAVLGVDSLQGLQVLAGVEKRFGIRLPDEELIHLRTIGRIADAVRRQQGIAADP